MASSRSSTHRRRARIRAASLLAALALLTAGAAAQGPTDSTTAPPERRSVSGQVVRTIAGGEAPVPQAWVTLHRVGSDTAGPLDSARTDARGEFSFRYTTRGSDDAVYFASATYGGITYFTPPLRGAIVSGDDARIAVFDTTSTPIPIQVRGRHVVVGSPGEEGRRRIVEIFELSNDTTVTLVAGAAERATWTSPLPPGARDFDVAEGDVSRGAMNFADGRALLFAPIAPGVKQIAFSYALPADAFPLSIPLDRGAQVFEILLEDRRGTAAAPRTAEVDPVTIEGRSFRRFLGNEVPAGAVARVTLPPPASGGVRPGTLPVVAGVIGAAMLGALALAFRSKRLRRAPAAAAVPPIDDAERLARAIADLDVRFEQGAGGATVARDEYLREREALKRRLADAMARRGAAGV